ncbi:MAG TPA: GFA family protein [Rhodanobacteraceae bacterium]|nr:GFA family protein [Rhodanobacteraceae bacterium]
MTHYAGGCLCGAVRYEADAEPINPHYCHCGSCRRASGAPVVGWANFPESEFRWTHGAPRLRASSSVMRRGFCAECGSQLCCVEDDGYVCVTIASLDDPAAVAPRYHIHVQHALPWLRIDDDLPREERKDRL